MCCKKPVVQCCTPCCVTTCTTKSFGNPTAGGASFGTLEVPISSEPVVLVLPDEQYITVNPEGACTDVAYFGSFRLNMDPGTFQPPIVLAAQLRIDDELVLDTPAAAPATTLPANRWTALGVRAIGKDRLRGGSDKEARLFAAGLHRYAIQVTVDTSAYVNAEPAPENIAVDFKGALTLNTSV
jgi:hypothetical protein